MLVDDGTFGENRSTICNIQADWREAGGVIADGTSPFVGDAPSAVGKFPVRICPVAQFGNDTADRATNSTAINRAVPLSA